METVETNCLVSNGCLMSIHYLLVPGSYAVLLYRILDFSVYHTDDNTAAGLLVQNVSNFLFFFFSNDLKRKLFLCSLTLREPILFSLDFEEHFTKL